MIEMIKDFIKTKPRLYDLFNSIRPIRSDMEQWFNKFSRANNKKINFIQIGASDGLRWDPVRRFVVRDLWSGIFVEPLPLAFIILKKNYNYLKGRNFVFINAAVSSRDCESMCLWSFSEKFLNSLSLEEKMFFLRMSSFDKEFVVRSLKEFSIIEDKIREISIPCLTITSLIKNIGISTI